MVAVLLGAGASKDAGLPTSVEMTAKLGDDFHVFRKNVSMQPIDTLYRFVIHSLSRAAASRGESGGLDIEAVFAAVEGLATRSQLPITPFVASWEPMVAQAEMTAGAGYLSGSPISNLSKLLNNAINAGVNRTTDSGSSSNSDATAFVEALLGRRSNDSVFEWLRQAMVKGLGRILTIESPDRVRYLGPLIDLGGDPGFTITTLNYDLTIESLGDLLGVNVQTGMDSWHQTGKLTFDPGVKLLKLHGSIDWARSSGQFVEGILPFEMIERRKGEIAEQPAVIFGAGNKLQAGGPYLELLRQFENSLERSEVLLLVGYSFRDAHVNAIVTNWMNAQHRRRAVILDKDTDRLKHYEPHGHLGNALVNRLKSRVTLINAAAIDGISDAVAAASVLR